MPASTSSKTSVPGPPTAATLISASITRESSPPEAVVAVGPLLADVEPSRLGVEAGLVGAQLRAEVVGLDPQRAQARGELGQARVGVGSPARERLGLSEQGGGAQRGVGVGLRREH